MHERVCNEGNPILHRASFSRRLSHVVPDIIASTLKDITRESDNRQGRLLFKLAVELAILQNVVAANYGISKTDLERLRGICVNEVKKINGSITFDEAIRWQS